VEGMAEGAPLLLNGDNDLLRKLEEAPAQQITYFGTDTNSSVRAVEICQEEGLLSFRVQAGNLEFPVEMALEGEHFVADALAAVAVGMQLGVGPEDIRESLGGFRNMAGRQEIFSKGGYTIIKDCYNAGPESMAAALQVLGNRKGRKIAVLGDMLELGESARAEHYKVGCLAAQKADMVFAYGSHGISIRSGAVTGGMEETAAYAFESREECAAALRRAARTGDVLLFKGSRGMRMELILEAFLKDR